MVARQFLMKIFKKSFIVYSHSLLSFSDAQFHHDVLLLICFLAMFFSESLNEPSHQWAAWQASGSESVSGNRTFFLNFILPFNSSRRPIFIRITWETESLLVRINFIKLRFSDRYCIRSISKFEFSNSSVEWLSDCKFWYERSITSLFFSFRAFHGMFLHKAFVVIFLHL